MKNKQLLILSLLIGGVMAGLMGCQPQPKAKHVIIIGMDGMSSAAYRHADMPFLQSQAETGAYALRKRSCLPSSSAINWATMLCGSNPELHGFLHWGTKTAELEQRQVEESGSYPSVFRLVRDQRPDSKIGYFYDWVGMKYMCDTLAMSDWGGSGTDDQRVLTQMAEDYIINEKPDLVMFAFAQPDEDGHTYGWESDEYMHQLQVLDSCTKVIVDATRTAGIYDDCIFIVIADHGGIEMGHGKTTMTEMEAPFIVWGKNIAPVGSLDEDYSMMNFDVGAIIADIMAVTPPQVWTGRSCFPIFK